MKRVIIVVLIVVGLLMLLGILLVAAIGASTSMGKKSVSSRSILEIDFEQGLIESAPQAGFGPLMFEEATSVTDVVLALDRASSDDKVVGLIARIGSGGMGLAHVQELRDAVKRFRASGKPAFAFSETFGEFGPGNGGYYLATAFDKIYLQPSGDVGLNGLSYETMFVANAFEKLDIDVQMDQRYEYKNAMNMYTETEYTEPHREAMKVLMDNQFDQMVRGMSEARGIPMEEMRTRVDEGPYLAAEALEAGLVDGLLYRDQAYDLIREKAGRGSQLLYAKRYLDRRGHSYRSGPKVALIYGTGAVIRGESSFAALTGQQTMGSDTVAAALRNAIDDDDVDAILLRVDSPGGSYVASDTIYRETLRAREAGKPLVVQMVNVAASGGYFVAIDAEHIVAQPGTITGSIGVLGGKMNTTGLYDKLGVSFDGVYSSENADMYSSLMPYDESGYARFQAGLNRIYEDFTSKVADGRGLELDRVLEIAKGRIWTGEMALEIGLVDALGGIETAIRLIRQELELEADDSIHLVRFPAEVSPWEQFFGEPAESSEQAALKGLMAEIRTVQPVLLQLQKMGLFGQPAGAVEMRETIPNP